MVVVLEQSLERTIPRCDSAVEVCNFVLYKRMPMSGEFARFRGCMTMVLVFVLLNENRSREASSCDSETRPYISRGE